MLRSGCRQLTHRSFDSPKWLEYLLALVGTCGLEMVRRGEATAVRRQVAVGLVGWFVACWVVLGARQPGICAAGPQ